MRGDRRPDFNQLVARRDDGDAELVGADLAQGIQDKQQEVDTLNETLRLQHRSAQLEKESVAAMDARKPSLLRCRAAPALPIR